MATPWFRLYVDAYRNLKTGTLPLDVFGFWVKCLCVASEHEGRIPPVSGLCFLLRMTRNKTVEMLASLMDAGLIEDHLDGGFTPHNWLKRQYKSDVSTERVKRFRNAHETFQKRRETKSETPPDTDTDTDTTATAVVQKPPSPPPMKCSFPDWEQSAFAIVERFPTTDAATVMRIIECGVQAHVGAAQHGTNLTDKILSTIIGEVTTEGQHNAMLYLRTLPTAVSNMVRIHERRKVNGRV